MVDGQEALPDLLLARTHTAAAIGHPEASPCPILSRIGPFPIWIESADPPAQPNPRIDHRQSDFKGTATAHTHLEKGASQGSWVELWSDCAGSLLRDLTPSDSRTSHEAVR
ncbi:hypothetical protein PtA15_8A742 [Puccinia triticina]|uniref:Uncharacterized protein n=1 Tax=Puccinia triticina TaxID=208348 RepID=A0ABY7CS31_9BASI|nr:uncharacterized protein PtA15_8A742 [Puccinia triticina]WAQ87835.1 hypothetical protein PtA15_8A742 [Puccinia triticina]WAR57712.1 hypothetical protein PtB15_8B765 [Puccinia triticina]